MEKRFDELDGITIKKINDAINPTKQQISSKRLFQMVQNGEITFDNAFQRGFVWDVARKSLLIHSIIVNNPVYECMAIMDDGVRSVLDGKQRIGATIVQFYRGEFALEGVPTVNVETNDGELDLDINGASYNSLPQYIRDIIDSYTFTMIILEEDVLEERVADIFFRLNNYKPMTAIELTRAKAVSQEKIVRIAGHKLFTGSMTAKALESYKNEDLVIKSYIMLHNENPSLMTKDVRPVVATVEISDEDEKQLMSIFDRISQMYNVIYGDGKDKVSVQIAKRLMRPTHMISVMPYIWKSIVEGLTAEQAAQWFASFFCGGKGRKATPNEMYNTYSGSGSMKKESIKKRNIELRKSWDKWLKEFRKNEIKAKETAEKISVSMPEPTTTESATTEAETIEPVTTEPETIEEVQTEEVIATEDSSAEETTEVA